MAGALTARRNIKLSIFASRLLEWEEVEIRAGLKELQAAGCQVRVMKPRDFCYLWGTFVDNQEQPLALWDDCEDNYHYYHQRLEDILH